VDIMEPINSYFSGRICKDEVGNVASHVGVRQQGSYPAYAAGTTGYLWEKANNDSHLDAD
jgi:hypothetical protein